MKICIDLFYMHLKVTMACLSFICLYTIIIIIMTEFLFFGEPKKANDELATFTQPSVAESQTRLSKTYC